MRILTTIILLCISISTFAQSIVTDRPDQTESSSTLGKSVFQLEAGILFSNNKESGSHHFYAPSVLLRYGITEDLELRLFTQHESAEFELEGGNRKVSGLNDIQIGTKLQVLKKESANTKIAFLTHIIIPTAKQDLGDDKWGIINKLAISHELSQSVGLGYNIGYDHIGDKDFLTWSLSVGFGLSEKLGAYIEPYGFWSEQNISESNFDAGLTFLVSENFQWDLSYGFGVNHKMNYISFGFSWRNKKPVVNSK